MSESLAGTVKWFDAKVGYGFIISPDNTELQGPDGKPLDVFVHYSKIKMEGFKKLEAGEAVSYRLVWSSDGRPQAEDVYRESPAEE